MEEGAAPKRKPQKTEAGHWRSSKKSQLEETGGGLDGGHKLTWDVNNTSSYKKRPAWRNGGITSNSNRWLGATTGV